MGKRAGFIEFVKNHWEFLAVGSLIAIYLLHGQYLQAVASTIISQPRKSDFLFVDYYELDRSSDIKYRFVPLKVIATDEQNITVAVGNIGFSEPVSPETHIKFDKPLLLRNYYRKNHLQFSRKELSFMYENGIIYDARRPQNIYISGWIVIKLSEVYTD
ncbi:hypothetical protein Q4520_20525 [Alteromonas sp. 1_MG-2023]|uniref:hypothetical protein n=1 Tax=unclassified Alteromonas TaxID=2614992 RepID=UPI0026E397FA|nr:hypothetical protein [Alteromonas sp. 1_MG-2023]MDO6477815.1 hypothetical protein [Alteromonas sp. 1_MG-2023]